MRLPSRLSPVPKFGDISCADRDELLHLLEWLAAVKFQHVGYREVLWRELLRHRERRCLEEMKALSDRLGSTHGDEWFKLQDRYSYLSKYLASLQSALYSPPSNDKGSA